MGLMVAGIKVGNEKPVVVKVFGAGNVIGNNGIVYKNGPRCVGLVSEGNNASMLGEGEEINGVGRWVAMGWW